MVKNIVSSLHPEKYGNGVTVHFAGDYQKMLEEKESVDANKEEKAGGKGKKVTVVRKLDEVADQPEEV